MSMEQLGHHVWPTVDRSKRRSEEATHCNGPAAPAHMSSVLNRYGYGENSGRPVGGEHVNRDNRHISVDSERLLAWKSFTLQHDQVLDDRVRTDERRRRAGFARQEVIEKMEPILSLVRATGTADFADFSQHAEALTKAILELREAEKDLAEMDDKLVLAESALKRTLPRILGSDRDETFEVLGRHDLHIAPGNSASATSDEESSDDEQGLSAEQLQYHTKLTKVDDLETKLQELQDIHKRIKEKDETELDARSQDFLQEYDFEIKNLKTQLGTARAELQQAQDTLQKAQDTLQSLPVSDNDDSEADELGVLEQSPVTAAMALSRCV